MNDPGDGGDTWNHVGLDGIGSVGKIYVDPIDPNVVYVASLRMHKSTDGGNTWRTIFRSAHIDQHALCINPNDNQMLISGNDGGVYLSQSGGNSFRKLNGLPVTQFYTSEIDYSFPERLYGGAQDNGVMRTITGNIDDWNIIYLADGFTTLIDPSILYFGANRLYKSADRAVSWSVISPDLTSRPAPSNLTYGTITTISVSSIDDDIIVAGTDDGNVQIKLDVQKRRYYAVTIFNSSGMEVKRIYSNFLDEGIHEFSFNAAEQPSGIYLCAISKFSIT